MRNPHGDVNRRADKPKRSSVPSGVQRVAELLDAVLRIALRKMATKRPVHHDANRKHAGASIGSLYQFFHRRRPLAEALLALATVERVTSMLEDLAKHAPGLSPQGFWQTDRVDLMLDVRKRP